MAPVAAADANFSSTWIVRFYRAQLAANPADLAIVEGVGGLMSPIAEDVTGLELMVALGLPVVLVGGSYLGAISHTLTALEVRRGVAKGASTRARSARRGWSCARSRVLTVVM